MAVLRTSVIHPATTPPLRVALLNAGPFGPNPEPLLVNLRYSPTSLSTTENCSLISTVISVSQSSRRAYLVGRRFLLVGHQRARNMQRYRSIPWCNGFGLAPAVYPQL